MFYLKSIILLIYLGFSIYTGYGKSQSEKVYPYFDCWIKGTKKNYDKAYDYFFAEFMAAFSCVQYQWISDIVNRD